RRRQREHREDGGALRGVAPEPREHHLLHGVEGVVHHVQELLLLLVVELQRQPHRHIEQDEQKKQFLDMMDNSFDTVEKMMFKELSIMSRNCFFCWSSSCSGSPTGTSSRTSPFARPGCAASAASTARPPNW